MTKLLAWLTAILVSLIALISFILSYNVLQEVAIKYGVNPQLSYLWPLLIDFSLVVFSLAVVTAHLHSESTWRQWLLVGLSTITTTGYNYLHAPDNIVAHTVAIIPPLMLFFSFEMLMLQLKNSIQRTDEVQDLAQQVEVLQEVIDDPITVRRERVHSLLGEGLTQSAIAEQLGVSVATIRKDKKVLNGHG